jgi:COP9 signalosome complex subunit 6
LFLLLTPPESKTSTPASSDLPLKIYESALSVTNPDVATEASGTSRSNAKDKFVELGYTVETGEAERIAVDGAAKATGSGARDGEHDGGDEGCESFSCQQ